jgi:hypothetical protein
MDRPKSLRSVAFALSFALTAAVVAPALGAEPPATTRTFFAPAPAAPELANAYLTAHPGDAIEISAFGDAANPTQIFHAFGPVARSRAGVCRFTSTQVFAHRADDGAISWDSKPANPREHAEPPYTMATVAGNPCPRQDEDVYVSLDNGIMDAELIAISNFWKEISKSEAKFDEASVYLSLIVSQRAANAFAAFRSALFQPGGQPPQMQAVFRAGVEGYDLAFGNGRSASSNFFLSISKSGTGFQVLNFQTQF